MVFNYNEGRLISALFYIIINNEQSIYTLKMSEEDLKKLIESNARAIGALANNFAEYQRIQENQANQVMSIARELQERQIQLQDAQEKERQTIEIMVEEMNKLIERSNRNERRIEQLIGYSITNESEHLDIEQRFRNLEARMKELES